MFPYFSNSIDCACEVTVCNGGIASLDWPNRRTATNTEDMKHEGRCFSRNSRYMYAPWRSYTARVENDFGSVQTEHHPVLREMPSEASVDSNLPCSQVKR